MPVLVAFLVPILGLASTGVVPLALVTSLVFRLLPQSSLSAVMAFSLRLWSQRCAMQLEYESKRLSSPQWQAKSVITAQLSATTWLTKHRSAQSGSLRSESGVWRTWTPCGTVQACCIRAPKTRIKMPRRCIVHGKRADSLIVAEVGF